jgi:hypothetical protein
MIDVSLIIPVAPVVRPTPPGAPPSVGFLYTWLQLAPRGNCNLLILGHLSFRMAIGMPLA